MAQVILAIVGSLALLACAVVCTLIPVFTWRGELVAIWTLAIAGCAVLFGLARGAGWAYVTLGTFCLLSFVGAGSMGALIILGVGDGVLRFPVGRQLLPLSANTLSVIAGVGIGVTLVKEGWSLRAKV